MSGYVVLEVGNSLSGHVLLTLHDNSFLFDVDDVLAYVVFVFRFAGGYLLLITGACLGCGCDLDWVVILNDARIVDGSDVGAVHQLL